MIHLGKQWLLGMAVAGAFAAAGCGNGTQSSSAQYPVTRKIEHTDNYHGTTVADPYHWLEADTAADVKAWVTEQNKVTFAYLDQIKYRQALRQRLEALYNYPKIGAPFREGEFYFFGKNDGLQNQSVMYVQKGLDGKPELVLDPNKLSADGTTRMTMFVPSKGAQYIAYGLSEGGSDWQEIRVMQLDGRKEMTDRVKWVKVSGLSWYNDGFFYSRYPAPKDEKLALSGKNENHQVYYHKLGTPQEQDVLVYEDKANPERFHIVDVTEDNRYLVMSISDRGRGKDGNAIWVRNLAKNQQGFTPVIQDFDYQYGVLGNLGDKLVMFTNRNAPNGRVVLVDPAMPQETAWKTIVAESKDKVMDNASWVGGKLFVTYMKDVVHQVTVYTAAGQLENNVDLPGLGTVGGFGGHEDEKVVFYTYTDYTTPGTIYKYDIATRKSELFLQPELKFDPKQFETKQVFYKSKDGTSVPMFIVYKKGLELNGQNPTILYGYGGFNISMNPSFNALRIAWLEQGGVYAVACLRGGGEYGEAWHQQGMKEKKQNVFDDFIAAAEWLISQKYTDSAHLAVEGRSNGGLLVGAFMTQRPELARVALPGVGVMDMLRFHKFTIGWNWIADYGSSDSTDGFKYLYAYSPYHNLKPGTCYPATLVTTADHDDRVVPAHSFKFAARLQECQNCPNPTLIRIDTQSGHGASNTKKNIETSADIFAFTWYNMGFEPTF